MSAGESGARAAKRARDAVHAVPAPAPAPAHAPAHAAPAARPETPGVRLYTVPALAAERPLAALVGVARAIAALDNAIEKRRTCARAIFGAMRLRRLVVLCGVAGSGRRTLVRAYCRHNAINLVELTEHCGVLSAEAVDAAYALARAAAPCVVLVHGCDAALLEPVPAGGTPSALQRTFVRELADAERDAAAPWSVLAVEKPYTLVPAPIAEHAYHRAWLAPPSYTRRGQSLPSDNFAARRALLRLFMSERAPNVDVLEQHPIYASCFEDLIEWSNNTTPRQLAAFLDRVFFAPLERMTPGTINTSRPDMLLPTPRDVADCLYTLNGEFKCIVPMAPEPQVVRPFEMLGVLAG